MAKDSLASSASDLYNRLGSAVSERGQMLDGLEDAVNSLKSGSENMLAQVIFHRLPPPDDGNRRRDLLQNSRREDGSTFDLFDLREYMHCCSFGGLVREWKELRNRRLMFSFAFLRGRESRLCIFVGKAV